MNENWPALNVFRPAAGRFELQAAGVDDRRALRQARRPGRVLTSSAPTFMPTRRVRAERLAVWQAEFQQADARAEVLGERVVRLDDAAPRS